MLHKPTTAEVAHIRKKLHGDKDDAIAVARDAGIIVCEGRGTVHKYRGDSTDEADLLEIVESSPNLLLTAGITLMWNLIAGAGGTAFNSTNAYLAIGTSTTAATASQTTLVSEAARQVVSGAPTVSTNQISFVTTFGTGSANVSWQETAVVNASTAGTLMNRLVSNFGTKTSSASWTYTHTLSLS